ncbi:MAG: hypothetical protein PHP92_03410 [Candidatus Nanoarchaeia archaeon]|nr:hypothetical protein [Candidatus Nanoarchaeia archaeon]
MVNGLRQDIERAINMNSGENESNTPDFILAKYLVACLRAFDEGVNDRNKWYSSKEHRIVDNVELIK